MVSSFSLVGLFHVMLLVYAKPAVGSVGDEALLLQSQGQMEKYVSLQRVVSESTIPPKCEPNPHKEECFGMVGSGCEKVPLPTWGPFSKWPVHGDTCPDGQQMTSAGSLTHDVCCYWCAGPPPVGGHGCTGIQDEIPSGDVFSQTALEQDTCGYEWRKAFLDQQEGRFWCGVQMKMAEYDTKFQGKQMEIDDMIPQAKYNIYSNERQLIEYRTLPWLKSMRHLCAPVDAPLHCIGPDCDRWETDPHGARQGTRQLRRKGYGYDRRWYQEGISTLRAEMGESDMCCSKQFKEVHHTKHHVLWSRKNLVGLCAPCQNGKWTFDECMGQVWKNV